VSICCVELAVTGMHVVTVATWDVTGLLAPHRPLAHARRRR
jgi:hypothetical protein